MGSSNIASEPNSPAMLTSFAATHDPSAASVGEQAHIAGEPVAPLVEGREEREVGPHLALQADDQRQPLPGATWVADSGRPGQRPSANADSATRSALLVRCPPTTGTS